MSHSTSTIGASVKRRVLLGLHSLATFLISLLIKPQGRRLLATASLYANIRLLSEKTLETDQLIDEIVELEELLNISSPSEKALLLPVILHQHIWTSSHLIDNESLTKGGMGRLCTQLIQSMPNWLKYDTKVMYDDFSLIVLKTLGPGYTHPIDASKTAR